MTKPEPWYLGERAEILATVMFTRLSGVSVRKRPTDEGPQLLVSLPGERGGRVLGLIVKGTRRKSECVLAGGELRDHLFAESERIAGDSPFPVGVAIVDMSDDSLHFGWLVAPVASRADEPRLTRPSSIRVEKIKSDDELRRVVDEAQRWYDARAGAIQSHAR